MTSTVGILKYKVENVKAALIQTWDLSKKITLPDFKTENFAPLISPNFNIFGEKNEWKWKILHRWPKIYTAAGSDGSDKSHLCPYHVFSGNAFTDALDQVDLNNNFFAELGLFLKVKTWNHKLKMKWPGWHSGTCFEA